MKKGVLPGKLRHRQQGGDGHGVEAITTRRCSVHVRVVDKVRHRRQHGGESPASCGTGGEHAAASVSRWHARGEGVGGAPLIEASGDDDNRRDKMALVAVFVLQRRHRRQWASREE